MLNLSNVSSPIYRTSFKDEAKERVSLKKEIQMIASAVDSLAGKKYHHLEQLITPEVVLMFMPLVRRFFSLVVIVSLQKSVSDYRLRAFLMEIASCTPPSMAGYTFRVVLSVSILCMG